MKILITNDDSIHARGLRALIECASQFGDVLAVAPDTPQSGKSSAITFYTPLRIKQHPDFSGAKMFSVDGTPVDCVKLALDAICEGQPDLVLSGINHGSNSGNAITYSGTMGAVLESCTVGIPSIGFSLLDHASDADFNLSRQLVCDIIESSIQNPLPAYTALNVNIPAKITPHGVKVCRAARGHWTEEYKPYTDPFGQPFYMLTGRFINDEPEATDTDEYWLSQGYISIVPVCPDMSSLKHIEPLSKIY